MIVKFYDRRTPTNITEIDCKIKNSNTVNNLNLILHFSEFPSFTNCTIDKFNLNYEIVDVTIFPNNIYTITVKALPQKKIDVYSSDKKVKFVDNLIMVTVGN